MQQSDVEIHTEYYEYNVSQSHFKNPRIKGGQTLRHCFTENKKHDTRTEGPTDPQNGT